MRQWSESSRCFVLSLSCLDLLCLIVSSVIQEELPALCKPEASQSTVQFPQSVILNAAISQYKAGIGNQDARPITYVGTKQREGVPNNGIFTRTQLFGNTKMEVLPNNPQYSNKGYTLKHGPKGKQYGYKSRFDQKKAKVNSSSKAVSPSRLPRSSMALYN